ncbi:MAG: 26S proteasome complex subunit [Stictis urceolatum]|nr:26S proteasome complex subunit [Stictis urceolata]
MSASGSSSVPTAKLQDHSQQGGEAAKDANAPQTGPAQLEEDDEFEDFPVEDWPQEDAEMPEGNAHLWEESWDDDDTSEDFSKQLKEELEKVRASK